MTTPTTQTAAHPERLVSLTLRVGAYLSFALVLIASAMGVVAHPLAPKVARVGIVVLLATPLVRIIAAFFMYMRQRDRMMVAVSLGVLLIVVGAALMRFSLQ